ncbi:MAG: N-acetylmuramoyl-L-alanine amidase [Bacteroidales bacterium]|nr:N-acetylmuramoyl-L-alanine amidase [Bacteroidales bacterium]
MRISVNCGHTIAGSGYGAVSGKYNESDINRKVGKELIKLLRKDGHTVFDSTIDDARTQNSYLDAVVRTANACDVDLFISLHCNASVNRTGHGVEVYTYKGRKLDNAIRVCYEVSRLGFRNRGIRDGSHLYVVKNTKAPALLIEMFFLDNETDQTLYKTIGYKEMARAIARAIQ